MSTAVSLSKASKLLRDGQLCLGSKFRVSEASLGGFQRAERFSQGAEKTESGLIERSEVVWEGGEKEEEERMYEGHSKVDKEEEEKHIRKQHKLTLVILNVLEDEW